MENKENNVELVKNEKRCILFMGKGMAIDQTGDIYDINTPEDGFCFVVTEKGVCHCSTECIDLKVNCKGEEEYDWDKVLKTLEENKFSKDRIKFKE
jgi:hypothetical protein